MVYSPTEEEWIREDARKNWEENDQGKDENWYFAERKYKNLIENIVSDIVKKIKNKESKGETYIFWKLGQLILVNDNCLTKEVYKGNSFKISFDTMKVWTKRKTRKDNVYHGKTQEIFGDICMENEIETISLSPIWKEICLEVRSKL